MKLFLSLSETAKIMLAAIGGLFLLFLCLGLIVIEAFYPFEAPLSYCTGLLAGSLLSGCKVILLERAIGRSLDSDGNKAIAQGYAMIQAVLRYLLTIVVLVCVFLFPNVLGLFGTILGILFLQLSAYAANPILRRRELTRVDLDQPTLPTDSE